MIIPKIIHQIWVGPKPPPMNLINSVIQYNPDYQHILWTEQKIEENKHLFKNYNKYKLVKPPAYNSMSDILRYDIVYHFGGFYMDSDFKFVKGIGDFFIKDNITFCAIRENNVRFGDSIYENAMFAATPNHPILESIINEINNKPPEYFACIKRETAFSFFGPRFFTENVKKWINKLPPTEKYKIKVFDSYYFFPYYLDGKPTFIGNEKNLDHIFAYHLWKNGQY